MAIRLLNPNTNDINEIKYTDENNNTFDVKCLQYNTQDSWAKPFRLYMNCTNGAVGNMEIRNLSREPNAYATSFGVRKDIKSCYSADNGRTYWGDLITSYFSVANYEATQRIFESTKIYYGSSNPVTSTGGFDREEEIYNVDLDSLRSLSNESYWNSWPTFSAISPGGPSKSLFIHTTGDYNTLATYFNALRWDSRGYPNLVIQNNVLPSTNYMKMYRSDYYDFDYFQLKIYVQMYDYHISDNRFDTYLYTKAIKLSEISTDSLRPTILPFTGQGKSSDSSWIDTKACNLTYLRAYLYRDTSTSYDHVMVAVEYTQGQSYDFYIQSYYDQQAVFLHEPAR